MVGSDLEWDWYTGFKSREVREWVNPWRIEPMEQDDPLLQFFAYEHLPKELKEVSQPFRSLAISLVETLPRNPERTVALRKLLEAKDCAVRARLFK